MLKKLLEERKFFKLVCGAGNEDAESVKRLVYVYAKAGCKVFDISARKEILDAAKEGVYLAGVGDVHFCVSLGIKGDPHISKAEVKGSKCIKCGNCFRNCPNGAVYSAGMIDDKRCIGCGICMQKCPTRAISMYEKDINAELILPEFVKDGVEIFELHITGHDQKDLDSKWMTINKCKPSLASICIDRQNFGNKEVISRIKDMISMREPYTTIIQADGIPMSGCDDSYKTTLQAAAMAEIVQNAQLPVYITVSGGTNSKTAALCNLCGLDYHGIAIGSWARKIVRDYVNSNDFWVNENLQSSAVDSARNLLKTSIIQQQS